jgi:site-specific DNA recombinase
MNAVAYINSQGQNQGTEMIQMQNINGLASKLNVTIVGYCFKTAPLETLLSVIQEEVQNSFDTIIVFSKDIISPNFEEVFHFINKCFDNGISVFAVSEGNLTKVLMSLVEANQKKIKKHISEETIKRMSNYAAQGKYLGGRIPFGYKRHLDQTVIDESQSPIIQKIFTLFVDGYSFGTIARILAERYDLHYGEKGRWRQGKLRGILTNPIYNGYPTWSKTYQQNGEHKRLPREEWVLPEKQIESLVIINNELWEMTQEKLKTVEL